MVSARTKNSKSIYYTLYSLSISSLTNYPAKNNSHKSFHKALRLKFYATYNKLLHFMNYINNSIHGQNALILPLFMTPKSSGLN